MDLNGCAEPSSLLIVLVLHAVVFWLTILRDSAWRDSLGAALPPGAPADNTLLINGAPVTVNPAASP